MGSEVYDGKKIRIRFEGSRCIHSRHCVLTRPEVFRPNVSGPWIDPEAADPEDIASLVRRCPSGALSFERLDGAPGEEPATRNVVRVQEGGPYMLVGDFRMSGQTELRATLCRCGQSKNKPWCDHSHADAGFSASGEPRPEAPAPEPWPERAPCEVTPQPDGPLLLSGPVEIVAGSGRTLARGTKFALCRCGQSKNKPFCDGTHRMVAFLG